MRATAITLAVIATLALLPGCFSIGLVASVVEEDLDAVRPFSVVAVTLTATQTGGVEGRVTIRYEGEADLVTLTATVAPSGPEPLPDGRALAIPRAIVVSVDGLCCFGDDIVRHASRDGSIMPERSRITRDELRDAIHVVVTPATISRGWDFQNGHVAIDVPPPVGRDVTRSEWRSRESSDPAHAEWVPRGRELVATVETRWKGSPHRWPRLLLLPITIPVDAALLPLEVPAATLLGLVLWHMGPC